MIDKPTPHTVICTAGHIDHGKSSLIYSLTGVHPDRLKEEQEREMTIDLGFGFYSDRVTFIDVPGHEKFLKTMLAGLSSVHGCILVIAADDGIMPQTREHFDILRLLKVPRGIIALTKIDLADEEWMMLVEGEIAELTAGTFLEKAPILPVSNRTGEGLDSFRQALDEMISLGRQSTKRGIFRLWIDRIFSLKGAGTIAAGTVVSGGIKTGDRVEILPSGIQTRIKRIQTHNVDVESASVGDRIALNLHGVDKNLVQRGDLLATPDNFRPTYIINARLDYLATASKPLEQRTRVRLHIGSAEYIGRVTILDGKKLVPNDSGFVQFRLETQVLANIGDRYVIRSFSEGRVLGGGVALEIHPPKQKSVSADEIGRLQKRESGEPRELTMQVVRAAGVAAIEASQLASELAMLEDEVIDVLGSLAVDESIIVLIGSPRWAVVEADLVRKLLETAAKELKDFHRAKPQIKGMKRTELRSRVMPNAPGALVDKIIELLVENDTAESSGDLLWLRGHQITFSQEQEKARKTVEAMFLSELFSPPDPAHIASVLNLDRSSLEKLITGLCELGVIVRLFDSDGKTIFYHNNALAESHNVIIEFFNSHDEMRFFEFRELIGTSRKFATPLLTYWDDHGLTYRTGEVRKITRELNSVVKKS